MKTSKLLKLSITLSGVAAAAVLSALAAMLNMDSHAAAAAVAVPADVVLDETVLRMVKPAKVAPAMSGTQRMSADGCRFADETVIGHSGSCKSRTPKGSRSHA